MRARVLRLAAFLALLPVAAVACIYGLSELRLRRARPLTRFATPIPEGPNALAQGERLARTRGCLGCHGARLEGQVFVDWDVDRAVAPNLARYVRDSDAATFETAVRQGVGRDGLAVFSMPSYNFARLADEDVALLYAYLRSVPVDPTPLPAPSMGLQTRWRLATGQTEDAVDLVEATPELRWREGDPVIARGEYLAMSTCIECHGLDLRGSSPEGAPDLGVMITAYPDADFRRLMKTGMALGNRELTLMSDVARTRFAYFTDDEVTALRAFLGSIGTSPPPQNVPWRKPPR